MKYKILSFIFIFLFLLAAIAHAQRPRSGALFIDTACPSGYDWKTVNIVFPEGTYHQDLSDSILRIDTVAQSEYLEFFKKYPAAIKHDTAQLARTDTSFTLSQPGWHKTFPAYRICECTASTYGGIIAPLNLYIVNTVDMHNETAGTALIDRRTGKPFSVPGCSDEGPLDILLSPKKHFLLTYSNTEYEHNNCCIYLLKINSAKAPHRYTMANELAINFDRLHIEGLAWIDETSFVMSVTEQQPREDGAIEKRKYCLKISLLK